MTSPARQRAESPRPEVPSSTQGVLPRGAGTVVGDNTGAGVHDETLSHHDMQKDVDDEVKPSDESRQPSNLSSPCPSEGQHTVVFFSHGDPENPYNWTRTKKTYVLLTCIALVMNSTIGSSLPSGASQETADYFHLTSQSDLVLPVSIFLIGYVLGPLVFAPMSEHFGRKWVVTATFVVFTAFNLGCALTPTYSGLIVMRMLVGMGASTPVSVIGGIYADIYGSKKARGRAVTLFMAATTWGPLVGPVISGFVATVDWRWTYWVALIVAGVTWPFVLFLPETYGPVLLRRKAQSMRKESGDSSIVAPAELERQTWGEFCTVTLTRPVRMFLFEWIVLFSCLYLSVAYAIFYMFFQAYPIIYQGTYGFSAGEQGLTFLPIGVGAVFAGGIYLYWEHFLEKAQNQSPPPVWSQKEEYVRLPIACLGAPLFAISLFWLGWTAKPGIHWIVPTLSALPFGVGFLLIFMSLINYIVDAYETFAASAMGAASCSRSTFGIVLPFAARPMYATLGIGWACSLLGFASILMGIIPFVFIKYGENIRANSKWCQELKRQKAEKEERQRQREDQEHSQQQQHMYGDPEKQV